MLTVQGNRRLHPSQYVNLSIRILLVSGTLLIHPANDDPVAPERKKREYKDMEEKHEGDLHAKVDMNTVSL